MHPSVEAQWYSGSVSIVAQRRKQKSEVNSLILNNLSTSRSHGVSLQTNFIILWKQTPTSRTNEIIPSPRFNLNQSTPPPIVISVWINFIVSQRYRICLTKCSTSSFHRSSLDPPSLFKQTFHYLCAPLTKKKKTKEKKKERERGGGKKVQRARWKEQTRASIIAWKNLKRAKEPKRIFTNETRLSLPPSHPLNLVERAASTLISSVITPIYIYIYIGVK